MPHYFYIKKRFSAMTTVSLRYKRVSNAAEIHVITELYERQFLDNVLLFNFKVLPYTIVSAQWKRRELRVDCST